MIIVSFPAPSILAPIDVSIFAKSIISGSFAAFLIVVLPSARVAAIIMFSVPVTVMPSKLIFVPINFFAEASM